MSDLVSRYMKMQVIVVPRGKAAAKRVAKKANLSQSNGNGVMYPNVMIISR